MANKSGASRAQRRRARERRKRAAEHGLPVARVERRKTPVADVGASSRSAPMQSHLGAKQRSTPVKVLVAVVLLIVAIWILAQFRR